MPETTDTSAQLLSNPVPSPLIDRDEPADAPKANAPAKATPAPDAEVKKTDIPAAPDENAETAPDANADEPRKESRRQRKLQREINARVAAETEARLLREQLAATQTRQAAPAEPSEPKRDEFEDYESYLRAVSRYDAKQEAAAILKAEREAAEKRVTEFKTQQGHAKQVEDWNKREKEFTAKVPTFEEDVTPFVDGDLQEFSKEAKQLIVDLGPEYLHKIATDDALIDELLALSPLRQVARIGRIDLSQASQESQPAASTESAETEIEIPETPRPRRADPPPPAKHVRQGNSAPATLSDDMATYIKQRKQQGARWARN